MLFINSNLPEQYQLKWRFLFSSQIHGESFSTLMGRIVDNGATVIIVEDSNGYIFGSFNPASWTLSPKFAGDESSFLFTLRPKMRCFPSTGYNDHYQYLNLHQQTMPNGLGCGGQHNYWGLWLDSEYGSGESSESCTTYRGYQQLSANKHFKIRNVEVWAVGEKPATESDSDEVGASGHDGSEGICHLNCCFKLNFSGAFICIFSSRRTTRRAPCSKATRRPKQSWRWSDANNIPRAFGMSSSKPRAASWTEIDKRADGGGRG